MWKGGGAIEVCVVFENMEIVEGCKGEVEVQKDTMGAVFGIKKVNVFGFIGNGVHYQVPIRWKVDCGDVVFTKNLKAMKGFMMLLLTLYLIWIVDFRTCISTFCCIADLNNTTLEGENREEEEEDECIHLLGMDKMEGQVLQGDGIYEAVFCL